MVYLRLFFSFMKIGFTSFGGMSMIPLILEEMRAERWMTAEAVTDLVAIAEMTPGPLGVNCATFAGMQAAGLFGGIAAVAGVLTPAFTSTLLVALFFERFKDSEGMRQIMAFVKPICIAMIMGVILTLSLENYQVEGRLQPFSLAIGAVALYLLLKRRWPIPRVIISAALLGMVCYGILPRSPSY